MTTYTHNPNNHLSRRASISATAPYTIPNKVKDHTSSYSNTPFSPPSNVHIPQHRQDINGHTSSQKSNIVPLSSSVPLLSREFVVRRISEGETGRLKEELKCEACGKGYKHISSLAKHLWEHTPEWNVTKKLLISKHQQVQLLEAASILVSMTEEEQQQLKKEHGLVFKNNEDEIKFKSTYQDNASPQPILEEDEDDEDDEDEDEEEKINIKLRTGSISQYPPSNHPLKNQKLLSPEANDSFLDTPSKDNSINGIVDKDDESNEDDDGVFGKMD